MRNIGDPAFFRTFDMLISAANPVGSRKKAAWEHDGTRWTFDRHSYQGGSHAFSTSVHIIEGPTRALWRLLVVREYWWGADDTKAVREVRWAKLLAGDRRQALAWFKRQDQSLNGFGLEKGEMDRGQY